MELPLFTILNLGFILGLKHATDADHIAAVTTFVSEERSLLRSCWIGLFWGAGHTLSLMTAGLAVLLFDLRIPAWLEGRLELGVAAMLVLLGARGIHRAGTQGLQAHRHPHRHTPGTPAHEHWHLHQPGQVDRHEGWLHVGLRPLLTGLVHGAAGSGALMLLVLSSLQSTTISLLYILVFGIGSVVGMCVVSAALGLPLLWAGARPEAFSRGLQIAAGVFSCGLGVYLGWDLL